MMTKQKTIYTQKELLKLIINITSCKASSWEKKNWKRSFSSTVRSTVDTNLWRKLSLSKI